MAEWQTRRPQKPLLARVCGFESHSGHAVTLDDVSTTITSHTLVVFPGQGSVAVASGDGWRHRPEWWIVENVSSLTGVDVAHLLLTAPNEEVIRTDNAQLATFTLSLMGWHAWRDHEEPPAAFAGHSLGEFSALVAAGVLSLEDGARLVAARGRAMAQAALAQPGTMVALMGPDETAMAALENEAHLYIANVNGPGQIVVSGTVDAVADLLERHKELGWRRASALNVGGAFHSPLMASAQASVDAALDDVTFGDTSALVGANVDGHWYGGGAAWRERLSSQLTSTVHFDRMIQAAPEHLERVVEMPPSGTLTGLIKRIRAFSQLEGFSPTSGANA